MRTITLYTSAELGKGFPEGFAAAYQTWKAAVERREIPWINEIMDSLKATVWIAPDGAPSLIPEIGEDAFTGCARIRSFPVLSYARIRHTRPQKHPLPSACFFTLPHPSMSFTPRLTSG